MTYKMGEHTHIIDDEFLFGKHESPLFNLLVFV